MPSHLKNKVGCMPTPMIIPRVPYFIAPSHGTLCLRKKVILPWCNLKSAFRHKTAPSGLRKRCYAEEILWNTEEWNTPSFNCPKAIVGDGKSESAMAKQKPA
jgi:hypothetical protein